MRRQRETTIQGEQQQHDVQRNLPTPYDVMRLQNCKAYKFRKAEMYPSIRPPVSQCNPAQTVALLSDAMEANGCGPVTPTLLDQTRENPYADRAPKNEKKLENLHVEFPCRDKKRKLQEQVLTDPEMAEKWSKMTPNELIRMHNCKTHFYQKAETYPTIRPTLFRCSVAKTAEALVDALEDNCCGRPFDMEQDDIMEVWKQSPHKNTLSFYGIGTGIPQPEAIIFNKVISQCLDKVNAPKSPKEEIPRPKRTKLPRKSRICDNLVLNRPLLAVKISKMPTVQQKLNAKEALKYIHCPRPALKTDPFIDTLPKTNVVEKSAKKVKSVKQKYFYCDLKCGIPENKCTALEWMKYRGDPKPYDEAFKKEMAEMEEPVEPEPKNYDELYKELVTCFEADPKADPLCEIYKKCCTKPRPEDEEEEVHSGGPGGGTGGRPGGKKKPRPGDKDQTDEDSKADKDKSEKDRDKHKTADRDKEKETDKDKDKDKTKEEREKDKDKDKTKEEREKDKWKTDKDKSRPEDEKSFASGDDATSGKGKTGRDKTGKGTTGADKDKSGKDEDKADKGKSGKPGKPGKPGKGGIGGKGGTDVEDESEAEGKGKGKGKGKDKFKPTESGSDIGTGTGADKKTKLPIYESDDDKKFPRLPPDISKQPSEAAVSTGGKSDAKSEPEMPIDDLMKPPKPAKPPKKPGEKKPGEYRPGSQRGDKPSFHKKPSHPRRPPRGPAASKSEKQPEREPPPKDCPCEICEFMRRRHLESDSPLIREMKLKEKRRKLRDYYRQMCRRQNEKCEVPELRAPQHKCDPIECDNTFCNNPKLAEYSDCLHAMHELQKLLGPKHRIVDNELVFNLDQLEDLRRRVCRRFCECL